MSSRRCCCGGFSAVNSSRDCGGVSRSFDLRQANGVARAAQSEVVERSVTVSVGTARVIIGILGGVSLHQPLRLSPCVGVGQKTGGDDLAVDGDGIGAVVVVLRQLQLTGVFSLSP